MTKDEALQNIEETLHSLTTDARWMSFLQVMSRFHRYSVNNMALIFMQNPQATYVKGYRAWQALGRQVQRGSQGLTIIAPIIKKSQDKEKCEQEPQVAGFRTATVFDIDQTVGQPVRGLPEVLQTADYPGLLDDVHHAIPFPVVRSKTLGPANGRFVIESRVIEIAQSLRPDMQIKTLLHEWAHGLRPESSALPRDREELVAESAAFVACKHFGLDTRSYSISYLASWSHGDPEKLRTLAAEVLTRSQRIIDRIDAARHRDNDLNLLRNSGPERTEYRSMSRG